MLKNMADQAFLGTQLFFGQTLNLLNGGVNAVCKLLIKECDQEYVENMLHSFGIMR